MTTANQLLVTTLLTLLITLPLFSAEQPITFVALKAQYSRPQAQWPTIQTADGRKVKPLAPLTLLPPLPKASHIALGSKLFNDTRLSKDSTVSCATCHEARLAFGDKRKTAVGIKEQVGHRNTLNIFGIDHWQSFFWDGRAATAQQQALMPIANPVEMDLSIEEAIKRVNTAEDYTSLIKAAFNSDSLTKEQMAEAIVAFERTIKPRETLFSRFIAVAQTTPKKAVAMLSQAQLKGLHLYRTKAQCMTCHNGPLLSDNKFHVTGLHFFKRKFQDLGRYEHTKQLDDSGRFRTPSLVMLQHTGPWMHNGLFTTMSGIVNQYNAGGFRPKPRKGDENNPLFPKTSDLLHKLKLTKQEKKDLVAFLEIL